MNNAMLAVLGGLVCAIGFGCSGGGEPASDAKKVAFAHEYLEDAANVHEAIDALLARIVYLETALAQAQGMLASHDTRITVARNWAESNEGLIDELSDDVAALQTGIGAVGPLTSRVEDLEYKTSAMTAEEVDGHPSVLFTGVNVHVRNGAVSGDAGLLTQSVNGLGNIILGYNEDTGAGLPRTGSHNLVLGVRNAYASYAGIVTGQLNALAAPYATITGGQNNTAGGLASAVCGGRFNHANGSYATIAGGSENEANGNRSSVSGGSNNEANATNSTVGGGKGNIVEAENQWAADIIPD